MSFILSAQREKDCIAAFRDYRDYLASVKITFPPKALLLATSDWFFDFTDHRCPHDGWLENISISEPATGERSEQRHTSIRIRLLNAYHDGYIELFYPQVFRYTLSNSAAQRGQGDWRYDEFRLSPQGHLIHEIEWAGSGDEKAAHWLIEATDIEYQWIPTLS